MRPHTGSGARAAPAGRALPLWGSAGRSGAAAPQAAAYPEPRRPREARFAALPGPARPSQPRRGENAPARRSAPGAPEAGCSQPAGNASQPYPGNDSGRRPPPPLLSLLPGRRPAPRAARDRAGGAAAGGARAGGWRRHVGCPRLPPAGELLGALPATEERYGVCSEHGERSRGPVLNLPPCLTRLQYNRIGL